MNKSALIVSLLVAAVAVTAAAQIGSLAPVAPSSLAETEAVARIPVSAEDVADVALDQEVDTALHHAHEAAVEADTSFDAIDAEMGIADMHLDSNFDLSLPVDSDSAEDHIGEEEGLGADEDMALLAEGESVSVAMDDSAAASDASETESASAAVDSDEDAAFLQVAAEDEDESEDESEEGSDDEGEAQYALIEQIVEANLADGEEDVEMPRLSEVGVELVADAETASAVAAEAHSGDEAIVADEDTTHSAESEVEMVAVEDFDTAKLAQTEADPVRTAGSVRAGLADATIEERNVQAEVAPVSGEIIALVSDHDARAAAGAPVSLVETDAAEAEAAVAAEQTEAEHDETEVEFHHQTSEEIAAEQQKLDLMHSILVQIRTEQGKPVDEELTPEDMDQIEEKMSIMVEVSATANADTETNADAEHPRDHILVAAIAPNTEDPTPGAKLSAATIIPPGGPKPLVPPKPNYRWDIQYHDEMGKRKKYLPNRNVELVDKPHPLHRRDPTAPSKLKKPVKPGVWDQRPWETRPKQQYRYDVQYEKRSACCRRREACCIRGVKSKTVPKKVKKPARIVDPVAEHRHFHTVFEMDNSKNPKKFVAVQYETERAKCCASKSVCCAPPQKMYRADVQYDVGGPAADYVVVATSGDRGLVIDSRDAGTYDLVGADELSVMERIQQRQSLLHKLLLSHDSPLYYDDHFDTSSDAHIVAFHEPAAARDPNQLTISEQAELQQWMAQLPVVPHLSVVEVSAEKHSASGDAFLQTAEGAESESEAEAFTLKPVMRAARVLKGFVDVEQEPHTLSDLLSSLPPTPASAEEMHDEEAEALAEAEADSAEDI